MSTKYPCLDCQTPIVAASAHRGPRRCSPCTVSHTKLRDRERARIRSKDPAVMRRSLETYRLRTYGITPEQFSALLESQGGCCAICRTDDPGRRSWHLDHCHQTGRWRGVLCSRCNRAVGLLRDDPEVCRRAADYLGGAV